MKLSLYLLAILLSHFNYSQVDSIKVFIVGNVKGESYKFYFGRKMVLSFTSDYSYKYAFTIPIDSSYVENQTMMRNLSAYRKFGLSFKRIAFNPVYKNYKYLIIWRNMKMKMRFAMDYYWSDLEPKSTLWSPSITSLKEEFPTTGTSRIVKMRWNKQLK